MTGLPLRDTIEKLLAALGEGAEITEGVVLRIPPGMRVTIGRSAGSRALLTFDPPPELAARRGPFHLRSSVTGLTVGADEIHLALDGWFDRRWRVEA